ncbi:fengycin non-ribosomal peptide synthetase FenC [Bacillus halotolerans]|uniref:fengycin non-ribosomal peptide synthetase FenC n=5 Tax=Bacillus halotolerans TaxID=260554 RepID=UPI002DB7FBAD|nr:fengycin non-ribosomal peptide synthetase FenC [Bacillus halotolerans]MEC1406796.1 fengycin non-ribosomal peptide synthetase FenC [Bacillus halotolerans]
MKENTYGLTHAQRRVWFTELLEPGTSICNLTACVKFRGDVDLDALQLALNLSISRNDAIRFQLTEGIESESEPRLYLAEYKGLSFEIIDFTNAEMTETEQWIHDQARIPFKLLDSPLYQFYLLRIHPHEIWLYAKFHHIIMDGISLNLMGNQIIDLYQKIKKGEPVPDEQEPSYISYIEKERQYLQSSRFEKDHLFWTQTYQQPPVYHSLTGQSTSQKQSTSASRDTITLSPYLAHTIQAFCEEQKISMISLFMASFYICISRITSKTDLAIGTYYGNRGSKAEKEMLGMFVSSLPIRKTVDSDADFLSFARSVGREQLSVMRHQRFPYNLLVNELRKEHKDLHNLIGISMQYHPLQWQKADDLNYETALYFSGYTANELSVQIQERIDTGAIQLNFDYQNTLFSLEDIKRIQHHLLTLLENALQNPHSTIKELDMAEKREKEKVLYEFNRTKAVSPVASTLHGLFERQAALTPDRTALRFSGGSLTYAQLDMYANRLAARLTAHGITKESIVGVLSERSPDMLTAVLAVLKAGGAYVPLDPVYPEERLSYMLKDSGAALLLTQPGLKAPGFSGKTLEVDMTALANEESECHSLHQADSDSLAYVIYTSGSTGRPKGVAVEHRQAVSFLTGMQMQFPLEEDDIIMMKTSFSFDASVWQLFWWTLSGASAYLLPSGWEKDPALMVKAIREEGVTTAHFIPAMLNSFLDQAEIEAPRSLKRVFAGGEPLAPHTAARFASLLPETSLVHGYGPTEATVDAAFYACDPELDKDRLRLPIGKPVPGARLYVLDPHLAVQPVGVAGELYIAGAGVARGYLNRPELTEERFLDDPFYPGERMYKTGDLAHWLPDGQVEFLGRLDDQVKIRGYRIEPGEIEAALRSIEGVREAAVTVRTESGEAELCAYAEGLGRNEVRKQLETLLPGYMIPAHIIEMEQWPVTPSGKLDRKALPAPDGAADRETYTAPRNLTEMKLSQLWEEVLKSGPVGIHDNFFDRGGHSLKATALVSRIAKEFGVQVPLKDVFAHPTVEGLASVISEGTESPYEAIKPAEKRETYPVSSAQKRMYVLQQLEDGGTGYNMPAVLELEGKLDLTRMEAVFKKLIKRHESLRTSFTTDADGEPVQRIHDEVPFTFRTSVLGGQTEQEAAAAFIQPFELSQAPLFRAGVVKVSDGRHLLLVDMHHIISDGVSVNTLIREFGELYANQELPALHIQYKDYAVWQEAFKKGDTYKTQEAYWLKQLEGELPVLDLPADYARPPVRSFAGDQVSFMLDQELTAGLHKLARENGSTLYMVLLAAYTAILARLSGQEDIIVGSPIAGRPHKDLEPILGMFVNTLALRTRPEGGKPFTQFLQEVRETALEAYEHQDYPFEELVDKLGVTRDMSRNPVFDAMFILQNMDKQDIHLGDIKARPANVIHQISVFDMTLMAAESDGVIKCDMEFSTDVFMRTTIERWTAHFTEFLRAATSNPNTTLSQVDILSEKEKQKILIELNKTHVECSQTDTVFHRMFEKRAEETPEHIAVIDGEKQISYRHLNEKANRLARTLQEKGKETQPIVAVLAERSIDAIVGILAVMKAGGVYIPIDSHYPKARVEYLLKDSGAEILLLQNEVKHLIAGSDIGDISRISLDDESFYEAKRCNLSSSPAPEDSAYIIYTSGTTGAPKGVIVTHHNFAHAVLAWRSIYQLDQMPVRLLQMASFSFDVFSGDLARTLANGGTLVICPDETRLEPAELYALMNRQRITIMESTPALIVPFMEYVYRNQLSLPDLDILILGSDMVKAHDFKTLADRFGNKMRLINSYGVTEATIDSSYYEMNMGEEYSGDSVPIGIPLPNVKLYVLSQTDQIQPIGIAGELCIGGAGIAKGYHGKFELTEKKFTENPFVPGERLYRTGDLACWLPNGTLRLLGRIDHQVKINGYRIETEEIESVLLQTGLVNEAVVAVQNDTNGQARLAAYILPSDADTTALRGALSKMLPAYMVPAYIIPLETMPLTLNGKLDRRALPAPNEAVSRPYTAPVNELQGMTAQIWEDVLSVSRVGIHDSFFELGGDSIKALQVSARLAVEGWSMTIQDLFRYPTVHELSGHITPLISQAEQRPIEGEADLTPIQSRFFDQRHAFRDHYNQSVMLFSEKGFHADALRQALRKLTEHHDALRMVFTQDHIGRVVQYNRGIQITENELFGFHLADWTKEQAKDTLLKEKFAAEEIVLQSNMNVKEGPLLQAGLFKTREGDHLLITIHHLAVDGVSWRILLEDLAAAYQQSLEQTEIKLPPKSDSYLSYANGLAQIAGSRQLLSEITYWQTILDAHNVFLPKDMAESDRHQSSAETAAFVLASDWTKKLLFETQQAYGTDANELLLTALGMALYEWSGHEQIVISAEGHGREGHVPNIDISRTVGWFTSIYPILLDMSAPHSSEDQLGYRIKGTKDRLRRVPHKGTGYGLLVQKGAIQHKEPEISFNYLGQFSEGESSDLFQLSSYQPRYEIAGEREREYELDINALITDGRLQVKAVYTRVFHENTIQCLMDSFHSHLIEIIEHCTKKKEREKTLSDFSNKELTPSALSSIENLVKDL